MVTIIFGGAFDPPHIEHVNMLKSAVCATGATRLVVVPTFRPPHKSEGYLPYSARIDLCKIAFSGIADELIVEEIERERAEKGEIFNYASDVLPVLKEKYGETVYLIGGDSIEYFDTWHEPKSILETCVIAVAGRRGYDSVESSVKKLLDKYNVGTFLTLDFEGGETSSSRIKAELLLGMQPDSLTDGVYDYIKKNGYFGDYNEWLEKLKEWQEPELFAHTKAVVLRAVDLNSLHNLKQDFKKTFEASLLHDNAKRRPSLDGLDVPADAVGTTVLHQFLGAKKAERDFGVTDEEVLSAIRYHTTAKANMSAFEKLIYTADSTSYDRDYEPIPAIRKIADEDFEKGFCAVLKYTYDKLKTAGKSIYPLTEEAVEYYLNKNN